MMELPGDMHIEDRTLAENVTGSDHGSLDNMFVWYNFMGRLHVTGPETMKMSFDNIRKTTPDFRKKMTGCPDVSPDRNVKMEQVVAEPVDFLRIPTE